MNRDEVLNLDGRIKSQMKTMEKILIIPIGIIEPDILTHIARVLQETYQRETVLAKSASMPDKTYNTLRSQYNSTKILKKLEALKPEAYELLLGVVDEDLYVPELNFVFGEADVLARVAVIALPRLRQEFYGLDPDRELFLLRASKEAIHELGHTCGLGHCSDSRCIMHFSNSLRDTDRKEPRFCAACGNKSGLVRNERTEARVGRTEVKDEQA
jgi:archaemetzincin